MKQVKCQRCGVEMPNLGGFRKWCAVCKGYIDRESNERESAKRSQGKQRFYDGYAYMILDDSMDGDIRLMRRIEQRLKEWGLV